MVEKRNEYGILVRKPDGRSLGGHGIDEYNIKVDLN